MVQLLGSLRWEVTPHAAVDEMPERCTVDGLL